MSKDPPSPPGVVSGVPAELATTIAGLDAPVDGAIRR